jgi:hypothetical protein
MKNGRHDNLDTVVVPSGPVPKKLPLATSMFHFKNHDVRFGVYVGHGCSSTEWSAERRGSAASHE